MRRWPLLALLLPACHSGAYLTVTVAPLPGEATTLLVALELAGRPAQPIEPYPLSAGSAGAGGARTFALQLPDDARGDARVGVGALSSSGCLVGTGAAAATLGGDSAALSVTLAPLPPCGDKTAAGKAVALALATPSLAGTGGGAVLRLSGFGFQPGSLVSIGDQPAQVEYKSPVELQVKVPAAAGKYGPTTIKVQNPGGATDSRPDLLRYYASSIQFGELRPYAFADIDMIPQPPVALAAADMNGDGKADLLAALQPGTFTVFPSSGVAPFFQTGGRFSSPGVTFNAMAAAPLTRDGRVDVAILQDNGTLLLRKGAGDGTLTVTPTRVAVADKSLAMALGDVDGDGLVDVVTASPLGNLLSLMINKGYDGQSFQWSRLDISLTAPPSAVLVGDLNGDGKADLITLSSAGQSLSVLLQGAGGAFAKPVDYTVLNPSAVALADLSGDGKPDLLVGAGSQLLLLPNLGGGLLPRAGDARITTVPLPSAVTALALADINGDRVPDPLILSRGPAKVYAFSSAGDGGFRVAELFTLAAGVDPVSLTTGDIDGDGLADALIADASRRSANIALNTSR